MRLDPLHFYADDGDPTQTMFVVAEPIRYQISEIYRWKVTVAKGFKTDLASLPPITRLLVRLFRQQRSVDSAGVVHDWLYATHGCARAVADAVFYQELREEGIPRWQCKWMHKTVRVFGWSAYKTAPKRLARNCPGLSVKMGSAPKFEGIEDAGN